MHILVLALLIAQAVPPQAAPAFDDDPSAFACTFDAALNGSNCVYEAAPGPGDARDNSKAAADAGLRACAAAARRDEPLRKDCEKSVAEASLSAQCALGTRLADAQGRLTVQARACVEAVRLAVSRTARAAALSLDCCKCLGESRCGVSASQCKHELADLTPGAALKSCMAKSCPDACAFSSSPVPAKAQPAPLDDPTHPDKI